MAISCNRAIGWLVMASLVALPVQARDRPGKQPDWASLAPAALRERGIAALQEGRSAHAIAALSELAARQPRDGEGQTLLALAYHQAGTERGEALDMALAGYDLATRIEPGQFWPLALAGRVSFDQGKYAEALDFFARAMVLKPGDPRVVGAVAASAYMSGDVGLARIAADRAVAMPRGAIDLRLLRIAAFAAAAGNDVMAARAYATRLSSIDPDGAASVEARIEQIAQTAAVDQLSAEPARSVADAAMPLPAIPNQITLDVAIVLSQNTQRQHSGLNLLDGLSLQYGLNRQSSRTISDTGGTRGNSYQRVLTSTIGLPQLNYNLNIFNRGGQQYSVVARPQLTAYRGEQSEFFIGRSIKVAVNGIQSGSLEQIDVGVELKVTPVEITETGTRVRIEAVRSFVTADPAGTFAEALTTFRQKVLATAEIRFGETLLLSGLNETVEDSTFSKTPVLGDIPLVGNLFSERNKTTRRDSVMVLVTPARPIALPGRAWARSEHVARLTDLWTRVIDPASSATPTLKNLNALPVFTRMTRSDVAMPFPGARDATAELLADRAPN
jgi:tetratricopeptide (TPR) repeat protein